MDIRYQRPTVGGFPSLSSQPNGANLEDYVFFQAPVDQVSIAPTGLAGLSRGFLTYLNRTRNTAAIPDIPNGHMMDDGTSGPIIFGQFDPAVIGIEPLNFEHTFWCKKSGAMASDKTTNSTKEQRVFLSGTAVREMLAHGQRPPVEFTRPEVADLLIASMRQQG